VHVRLVTDSQPSGGADQRFEPHTPLTAGQLLDAANSLR
jgi:hypothetical protein